jgi:hypothetical protein
MIYKYIFYAFFCISIYSCKKKSDLTIGIDVNKKLYAIGQFKGSSTCTATYIEIPNQSIDSPAYIITNGHCAMDFFEDNAINVDVPLNATILFKQLENLSENESVQFTTKRIAYSTMKGTDLAIIELNHTNRALQNAGIYPLPIANSIPDIGTKIQAYGYPLAFSSVFLRSTSGEMGEQSTVAEFIWLWNKFYAANFPNISPGSSGSPVFTDLSKGIWGLVNTTTIGGLGTCELGAPCEFSTNRPPIQKNNTTYILDILKIKDCFNTKGSFDMNAKHFPYEKPSDFTVSLQDNVRNFNATTAKTNKLIFNVNNHSNTSYKIELFENYHPENTNGFNSVQATNVETNFPTQEGFYIISIIKDNKIDQAKYLTFKMDYTPPAIDLIKLNQIQSTEGYEISPIFAYPELTQFNWKFGSKDTCNCNENKDYTIYNRIPRSFTKAALPVRVCVKGLDLAGNETDPKEFLILK